MDHYENVKKCVYTKKNNSYVALKKYILVYNEEANEKYLLLNLRNCYRQPLLEVALEITQLDANKEVLNVSTLNYDNFNIQKNKDFVPYIKIIVNRNCEYITANLVHATFTNAIYDKGTFIKTGTNKKTKKTSNVNKIKTKTNLKLNRVKLSFMMIYSLFALAIFTVATMILVNLYRASVGSFIDGQYQYYVRSYNEVEVSRYIVEEPVTEPEEDPEEEPDVDPDVDPDVNPDGEEGEETEEEIVEIEITIPAVVNGYRVVSISTGVFRDNESIVSVNILSESVSLGAAAFSGCINLVEFRANSITDINRNCFQGCTSLTTFAANSITNIFSSAFADCTELEQFSVTVNENIRSGAFENCISLREFRVEYASLDTGVLENCNALQDITCGNLPDNRGFSDIFGTSALIPASLRYIGTNAGSIYSNTFSGVTGIEIELLNKNAAVEFGALENCRLSGYSINERLEILNNEIISVNCDYEEIEILSNARVIFGGAMMQNDSSKIRNVVFDCPNISEIPSDLFKGCMSMSSLMIASESTLQADSLSNCGNLEVIYMPVSGSSFNELFSNSPCNVREVLLNANRDVPKRYFNRVNSLESIEIHTDSTSVNLSNIIRSCRSLTKLTIPHNIQVSKYGDVRSIEEVRVIGDGTGEISSDFFNRLTNLKRISISNVGTISSYLLKKNTKIESLTIDTVTNIETPLIGTGCTKLSKVSVPFVGRTISDSCTYEDFNYSSNSTNDLRITNSNSTITTLFSDNAANISKLVINSRNVSNPKGLLSRCSNLQYLDISFNVDALGALFTAASYSSSMYYQYVPATLKTVVLGTSIVGDHYFYNCDNLANIIIHEASTLSSETLRGCDGLKNLYVSASNVSTYGPTINNNNYSQRVNVIHPITSSGYGYGSGINVDYANYADHCYTIHYDGETIPYYSLLLGDINEFLSYIILPSNQTLVCYDSSSYRNILSEDYYASDETDIYVRAVEYSSVDAYIDSSVKVTYHYNDDDETTTEVYLESNQILSYEIPSRDGYLFTGWYNNRSLSGGRYNYSGDIDEDLHLYAAWQRVNVNAQVVSLNSIMSINFVEYPENFVFMPVTSGTVVIRTTSNADTLGVLYDSLWREVASDDNSGTNGNFRISYNVRAGEMYYFSVDTEAAEGECQISLFMESGLTSSAKAVESYAKIGTYKIISSANSQLLVPSKENGTFMGWYTDKNGRGTQVTDSSGNVIEGNFNGKTIYAYFRMS